MNNSWRCGVIVCLLLLGFFLMGMGFWLAGVVLHLGVMGPLLWGTLSPNARLFGPIQTDTGTDDLWLTIDDGPDPVDTPALLKLLQKHRVKAIFFVIGDKAERYPELIQQIHDEGHEIGNHSWSHSQAWFWSHGPMRTRREIERCQQCVESITGVAPRVFRAPVGHHNVFVHEVLRRSNLRLVGWSSRGYDAVSTDAEEVTRRICGSMRPGAILLVHESTPIAEEVVEAILVHAEKQGWTFSIPG